MSDYDSTDPIDIFFNFGSVSNEYARKVWAMYSVKLFATFPRPNSINIPSVTSNIKTEISDTDRNGRFLEI